MSKDDDPSQRMRRRYGQDGRKRGVSSPVSEHHLHALLQRKRKTWAGLMTNMMMLFRLGRTKAYRVASTQEGENKGEEKKRCGRKRPLLAVSPTRRRFVEHGLAVRNGTMHLYFLHFPYPFSTLASSFSRCLSFAFFSSAQCFFLPFENRCPKG